MAPERRQRVDPNRSVSIADRLLERRRAAGVRVVACARMSRPTVRSAVGRSGVVSQSTAAASAVGSPSRASKRPT